MKESFRYLIAKNNTSERKWLPLWVHCMDTYQVMKYLLSHWFTDGALYSVTKNINPDEIKGIALFLSIFHDYGKSSITFQAKISEGVQDLQKLLNEVELSIPSLKDPELRNNKEMPHGIAGEILLLIKGCPAPLAAIIGAHHGRPWEKGDDIATEIEEILEDDEEDLYRNFNYGLRLWGGKTRRKEWIKAQDDFFRWAFNELGLSQSCFKEFPSVDDAAAIILSGLVIMADWIASNDDYFPLINYEQDEPQNMEDRASCAMEKIKLPPTWRPKLNKDVQLLSQNRFGFQPNEIQTEVAETVINSNEPGLFILEAPMGVGKTEAALLAAEEFSENRVSGILFALPTQATANGIFPRILEWGEKQASQNVLSIRLAHGMAKMNKAYTNLMDNGEHTECTVDDYENNRLIVHDFFQGSKQALLADFVVGTVDQVLLASLKQKHFMLRHLGLCGKMVIIDECHAYDAYMNEYLERTLQWLGAYRTPVIMLSATLPYERRSAFVDAYRGFSDRKQEEFWQKSVSYPLLTWTDGKAVFQKTILYSGTEREVEIEKLDLPKSVLEQRSIVIRILSDNLAEGGCAAVVVNTVKRAQEFARAIKKALPEKNVILLHSRFIAEDRNEYEKALLAKAGKASTKADREGLIVIGTQVIEQSLDFDVDMMITDLCPIDLLLQRIGRLHRHPCHDVMRPDNLKKAKCFVLDINEGLEKGSKSIYGSYLLMRTRSFLPKKITLPTDVAVLVQSVYDDTYQVKNASRDYEIAREEHWEKRIKACRDADAFRLISPGRRKTINRFLEATDLADEEQAKAQVRNGEVNLEVIMLFSTVDGLSRAPWRYKDRFDTYSCPSLAESREIANQSIKLPAWVTGEIQFSELEVPKEWAKTVWLNGKHLLVLDKHGEAEIGDLIIRYDRCYGLYVERRNGV